MGNTQDNWILDSMWLTLNILYVDEQKETFKSSTSRDPAQDFTEDLDNK